MTIPRQAIRAILWAAMSALGLSACMSGVAANEYVTLEAFAEDLERPVSIAHAGDGSGRLFIVQQDGQVLVHDGARVLEEPFLDIADRVSCCGERGLFDIAFHPDYARNGTFFVHYSDRAGDTAIARMRVSNDPNRADPNSVQVVLRVAQPYRNHNGGQIRFGPDGFLYIALGDGGSGGDPGDRAQNLGELLGKMLRIDVDRGDPYAIPAGNPFIDRVGARPEIWAYGLRNPWRFSFDRETGDLFIADVGQNAREEVNWRAADSRGGENYGWRLMEGRACYNPRSGCNDGSLTMPILEVPQTEGDCSITGGYRYRGARYAEARGLYIYGDYCSGRIWAAADANGAWRAVEIIDTGFNISSFGEDEAGELYVADHDGTIYRLVLHPALKALRTQ
jgi:glucose/arabinose dehydrogenase